jgi:predicted secreted protein
VAIAAVKTDEIQSGAELLEISSPSQGAWKQFITARKEWSVNVGYLVISDSALQIANATGIQDLLQVGNTFTLKVCGRNDADTTGLTGNAILKTCKITASIGNLVQGSFSFVGTGALSVPPSS